MSLSSRSNSRAALADWDDSSGQPLDRKPSQLIALFLRANSYELALLSDHAFPDKAGELGHGRR
jgi:hypothetical protein